MSSDASGRSDSRLNPRKRKNKVDNDGTVVTVHQTRVDKKVKAEMDAWIKRANGVVSMIKQDPSLWGAAPFTQPFLEMTEYAVARRQDYPFELPRDDHFELPVSISDLSDEVVQGKLTRIVQAMQDWEWVHGNNDADPVLQVTGVTTVFEDGYKEDEDKVKMVTLTLADADGLLITCRIATNKSYDAFHLKEGDLVTLKMYYRFIITEHDDVHAEAAILATDFEVCGRGNVVNLEGNNKLRGVKTAKLPEATHSGSDKEGDDKAGSEEEEDDKSGVWLEDWDPLFEPPPKPPKSCNKTNRECSMHGVHFFSKCICQVMPVPVQLRNLETIADSYYRADGPVAKMEPNEIRNMLYWSYATNIYGLCGADRRGELPTCLVYEIRKLYPNKKDKKYVGYKSAVSEYSEAELPHKRSKHKHVKLSV